MPLLGRDSSDPPQTVGLGDAGSRRGRGRTTPTTLRSWPRLDGTTGSWPATRLRSSSAFFAAELDLPLPMTRHRGYKDVFGRADLTTLTSADLPIAPIISTPPDPAAVGAGRVTRTNRDRAVTLNDGVYGIRSCTPF